ncbi:MAG TPA: DUF4403 family protein [Polyangiaceae bacterium]|nr:DUF4403 family protein [Polyangiaceae bacterium]
MVVAICGALLLPCCGGTSGGAHSGSNECRELPTGSLPPAAALVAAPEPGGSLQLEVSVDTNDLVRVLQAEIPRVLVKRKDHPIGAPGNATFEVTRGTPRVKAQDGKSVVVLPLAMDISVCKPFGPVCVGYGSCQPRYDVTLTASPQLDGELHLSPPRLDAQLRQGCTIGIDVTDHVTRALTTELNKVKPLLRRFTEQASDELAGLVDRAASPVGPHGGPCASVTPELVTLTGFTTRGSELVFGASLRVGLKAPVACDAPDAAPHRPDVKWTAGKTAEQPNPSLRWVESLSRAELETRLRARLGAGEAGAGEAEAGAPAERTSVELAGLQIADGELLLELRATGESCGPVLARATLGASDSGIAVQDVTVPGLTADDPFVRLLRSKLAAWVVFEPLLPQQAVRLLGDGAVNDAVNSAVNSAEMRACGLGVKVAAPPAPQTKLLGTTEGLTVVTELQGRLGVTVKLGTPGPGCELRGQSG